MKRIEVRIIMVVLLCSMAIACDSFTEVELPESQLTGQAVYEDAVTATAALSDLYARLRENGVISGNLDGTSQLMGLYADELDYYGSPSSPMIHFYNHTLLPSDAYVTSLWSGSYAQIYAANAIIEGLDNSTEMENAIKERLQGEALFLRALIHFYLMNLYGAIPYVSTTDYRINAVVSRDNIAVVTQKIIDDLVQARQIIPEEYADMGRTRVNKATVQAFLARVYLYDGQWELAAQEATAVISNTAMYDVEEDLEKVFLKDSRSTIWQLHPGIAGANTLEGRFFIFVTGPPPLEALSTSLIQAFESGDLRRSHWVAQISDGNATWFHSNKYKQNGNTGNSQEYSVVMRLEEQYLIRAEANAELNNLTQARLDLDYIRNRSNLAPTVAISKQEVLDAIVAERRIEFFTEQGHRWFDLKRKGLASEALESLKPSWEPTDILLPVPENELLLNSNLQPQNSGY